MDNSSVNYFAETDFRGKRKPFGIKSEDRNRHIYVIGKTGMGKSTLLENMIIQDIKNGAGVGFIDPHGKSAETMLSFVPPERVEDVVYFAPFDLGWPIAFNVMEDVGPEERHLVANGLMSTFKKIWPDVWSARMEYILGNTILALLEYPDSTLLGVNRMLSDKKYREKVVDNVSDPTVRSFWLDEFAKYNERYMQEAGDAIKNKIGQFTSNPLIRNIVGQPKSTFDVRQLMDEKKILIINLSKGKVGEQNASLLGGMMITKIYLSAMSRANVSNSILRNLPPFYFYVDEFQSFVNDSFADILSEARKYKLSLTIAHQYIEQMPETVSNAVFGNVGTIVTFRVGPFDAEILEKIFFPTFTKEDLVNLGFAQIYLTMMIDGVGSPPFSAVTLPPIVNLGESFEEQIISLCRKKYAKSRQEVEELIKNWYKTSETAQLPIKEKFSHTEVTSKKTRQPSRPSFSESRKESLSLKDLKGKSLSKTADKKAGDPQKRQELKNALLEIMSERKEKIPTIKSNNFETPTSPSKKFESKQADKASSPQNDIGVKEDKSEEKQEEKKRQDKKEISEEILRKILEVDE
ncbi:MAG TPA: DUF87 domain-containing protein [Candidatus Vogelbacteria bacterium]|nr:DUF87 domain-containing protein [Candidatus Vogelbacteria bacterium]